jgi:amino acid permease
MISIMSMNVGTIAILVYAAEAHQAFDLGALLALLPGRLGTSMQWLTNLAIWFTCLLTLVGYIIAIHDSAVQIPFIKTSLLGQDSDRWIVAGIASLLVLPLCFLDQKYLSFTSVLAILVNVNLLVLIFYLFGKGAAEDSLGPDLCWLGFGKGTLTMVSTTTNSIIAQMCILPMYQVIENRTPERFCRVLFISFGCLFGLLVAFSVLAYMAFGTKSEGNILVNLPVNGWTTASQAGVIVVIMAVFPIFLLPMVAPLRSLDMTWFLSRQQRASLDDDGGVPVSVKESLEATAEKRRRLFTSVTILVIIVASFAGACQFKGLGPLNAINGSICAGVFSCLGPGLVGFYLLDKRSAGWKAAMIALLLFGALAFCLGLIFTDNDIEHFKCLMKG